MAEKAPATKPAKGNRSKVVKAKVITGDGETVSVELKPEPRKKGKAAQDAQRKLFEKAIKQRTE